MPAETWGICGHRGISVRLMHFPWSYYSRWRTLLFQSECLSFSLFTNLLVELCFITQTQRGWEIVSGYQSWCVFFSQSTRSLYQCHWGVTGLWMVLIPLHVIKFFCLFIIFSQPFPLFEEIQLPDEAPEILSLVYLSILLIPFTHHSVFFYAGMSTKSMHISNQHCNSFRARASGNKFWGFSWEICCLSPHCYFFFRHFESFDYFGRGFPFFCNSSV